MLAHYCFIVTGLGIDHKDNMVEALPTLKERLQKGDPNVLYSVVNDLSKVNSWYILIRVFPGAGY